tara:strand:- start:115 stop:306 length:192 start_codon:yes stop_codon:yes gene_type:complete
MKCIKRLFGLTSPLDKKKKELSTVRLKAMQAQRNGDLRTFADLSKKAEQLEDDIVELLNGHGN